MIEKYFFSKYSHKFIKDDTIALYNSLRMKPVFLPLKLYDVIKNIDKYKSFNALISNIEDINKKNNVNKAINELIKNKILINSKDFDDKVIKHFRDSIEKPYIQIAYFILSERCNFDCSYCFIKRNNINSYKNSDMSLLTALKALKLFSMLIKKDPTRFNQKKTIIFYGGEPLLNFNVLQNLLSEIKDFQKDSKLPKNLDLSIITNGSLITSEMAKYFREYNVSVAISIDGNEYATNSNRKFNNSQSTYDHIKRGIDICKNENVNVSLSVTLSEISLLNPENTINAILEDITIKSLGFNILFTDNDYKVSEAYNEKASKFIIDAFKVFRKKNIYEDKIMRKLNSFFDAKVYPFDCGATGGNQIVISPEGKIGICHGFLNNRKYFDTDIYDTNFDPKNSTVFIEWNKRSPLNMQECQDCPALGICGGGCPMNAYNHRGSIWSLDERFCVHAKMTLEWLIWDLYSQIQKKEKR